METEELMIGDWVSMKDNPYKVASLSNIGNPELESDKYIFHCLKDEIEPIPLTSEILEKNGFVKHKTQYGEGFYEFWSEDFDYCIYLYLYGVHFFLFDNINMQIKYVHQLQHMFINFNMC